MFCVRVCTVPRLPSHSYKLQKKNDAIFVYLLKIAIVYVRQFMQMDMASKQRRHMKHSFTPQLFTRRSHFYHSRCIFVCANACGGEATSQTFRHSVFAFSRFCFIFFLSFALKIAASFSKIKFIVTVDYYCISFLYHMVYKYCVCVDVCVSNIYCTVVFAFFYEICTHLT